jgi:hypothetical protein
MLSKINIFYAESLRWIKGKVMKVMKVASQEKHANYEKVNTIKTNSNSPSKKLSSPNKPSK